MNTNILVIDDENDTLNICSRFLSKKSFNVFTAPDIESAKILIEKENIECIVTDLVIPGQDGLSFVKEMGESYPDIPVLVMSGKATVKMAVEAMREGAQDFIEKPINNYDMLALMIDKALQSKKILAENRALKQQLAGKTKNLNFIGASPKLLKVLDIVKKIAPLNTTILIQGNTGTGKELLANLIHESSQRAGKPFVPVNCGAVPDTLLESLLFGHSKGAFTGAIKEKVGLFEEAHNGTLFLDEIGETSTAFQVKLLRVLQEKKIRRVGGNKEISVDVRIITATNKNLEEEVNAKRFRKDLFYRLNVIKIDVPSLNERHEDIPLLANHFLKNFMRENGVDGYRISKEAMSFMKKAKWEGNVRELQNAIEYSAALCSNKTIEMDDFPDYVVDSANKEDIKEFSIEYAKAKTEFERIFFKKLMKIAENKMTQAARLSGMTRQHIWLKLKELELHNEQNNNYQEGSEEDIIE